MEELVHVGKGKRKIKNSQEQMTRNDGCLAESLVAEMEEMWFKYSTVATVDAWW